MVAFKFLGVVVGVFAVATTVTASEICTNLPQRTGVGRDTNMAYDDKSALLPVQSELRNSIILLGKWLAWMLTSGLVHYSS